MNLKKVIPVQDNIIAITWFVGNVCNYSCYYCKPGFHNGSKKFDEDYTPFLSFVDKVKEKYPDKKIAITVQGGEVTLWNKLPHFLKDCHSKNYNVQFITNGSISIDWWKNNIDFIEYVIISYHTQYAKEEHIRNLSKLIHHKAQINMMITPERFEDCVRISRDLAKDYHIPVFIKYIRRNFTTDLYDYSKSQLKFIYNIRGFGLRFINNLGTSSSVYIINQNKIPEHIHVSKLFLIKNNKFMGWKCWGGLTSFFVDFEGDIYRGQCITGKIGNIYTDKTINLPNEPYICDKPTCNCIADLSACRKEKIDE